MTSVPAGHMHVPAPVVDPDPYGRRGTGWLVFAAAILGLAGFMRIWLVVGIVAAMIGALSAMVWMPYHPVWSLAYIVPAVLVFYALLRYAMPLPD